MTFTRDTLLDFDGVEQPISEHALDYGIPSSRIIMRLVAGWSVDQAITRPILIDRQTLGRVRETKLPLPVSTVSPSGSKRGPKPRTYTHNGETLTISEWAEARALSESAIYMRLREGLSFEQAIYNHPQRSHARRLTFNGKTLTLKEWSVETGLSVNTIRKRIVDPRHTLESALTLPYRTGPKASA